MNIKKFVRRTAALAVLPVAFLAVSATSASAAEGTWQVGSGGCVALEKVILISGHDYMAIDPIVNNGGCSFGIYSWATSQWLYGPTGSGAQSPWIYDGPGQNMSACVWGGSWSCGPAN
ncbi:hypothetical protein [Kitasatospora sp. MAP5-34]|uniref:hypothetical protein n=1 Tax=Kitasatospora sp. MAP5-34 TaxID=3035102 RepID=UPI002474A39D|nr:hypothetical protein [Kitasatospora sp. MAP5-34]